VVRYSNGSDTVLDDDVLVIMAVFNLHEGPDLICMRAETSSGERESLSIVAHRTFAIHGRSGKTSRKIPINRTRSRLSLLMDWSGRAGQR
jgi:hypothetical protein